MFMTDLRIYKFIKYSESVDNVYFWMQYFSMSSLEKKKKNILMHENIMLLFNASIERIIDTTRNACNI